MESPRQKRIGRYRIKIVGQKRKPPPRPPLEAPAETPSRRYRIEWKPAAERDLTTLERKDLVRVSRRIDALADNPRPPGVEKIKGADDIWRVRAGDFRIIYTIRDEILLVLVVRIGHRRDVYRRG